MPRYVDGYVLPVPKKSVEVYRRLARIGGRVWREHGALQYFECVGDDLKSRWGVSFPRRGRTRPGETVVFSFVVFRSKAHRDRVNAKVMKDSRIANMDMKSMPFDSKRMTYGGFRVLVQA